MLRIHSLIAILLFAGAASSPRPSDPVPRRQSAPAETGPLARAVPGPRVQSWWADYDGDGLQEALLLAPSGEVRLLRNLGEGVLEDVTDAVGLSGLRVPRFAVWEDYDRDGVLDLLVGAQKGSLHFFRGAGGVFRDATAELGLDGLGAVVHGEWLDYDRDGHLDLCVRTERGDELWRNPGLGPFERVDLALPALVPQASRESSSIPSSGEAASARPARGDDLEDEAPDPASDQAPDRRTAVHVAKPGAGSSGSATDAARVRDPFEGAAPPPIYEAGGPCPPFIGQATNSIKDQASGSCILASSDPLLDHLYPLGAELFIDPAGNVGINALTPVARLHLHDGDVRVTGAAGREIVVEDGEGDLGIKLDASFNGGANDIRLYHDGNVSSSYLRPGDGHQHILRNTTTGEIVFGAGVGGDDNSGFLEVRDLDSNRVIWIDADHDGVQNATSFGTMEIRSFGPGGTGGELDVQNNDGNTRVNVFGGGSLDGGLVQMFNATGGESVRIDGEDGGLSSELRMWGSFAGGTEQTVTIEAEDAASTGGAVLLSHAGATGSTVELDGSNSSEGEIETWETDGSRAFRMFNNVLTLYDAAGTATITLNGATGVKNGVQSTADYGQRLLYAVESPEVWFEDFGRARLSGGVAKIDLDPIFLQTVTIDEEHPMMVFVTPTAPCNGVYVETGRDHFVVRELASGRSEATFNWRLVAKRAGHEEERLESYGEVAAERAVGSDAEPAGGQAALPSSVPDRRSGAGSARKSDLGS